MNKKKIYKYITITTLSIIFVSGIIYLAREFWNMHNERIEYEELAVFMKEEPEDTQGENQDVGDENQDTSRIDKVKKLNSQNTDIIAWIEIYGTNISYPVLQGNNNSYYLEHDYKKRSTARGSIVLDIDVDLEKPSTNFLIFGHRNKNNVMFENLYKYKDESFYKTHKNIRFTTLNEDMEFEVIAAFRSKSYTKEETNVFKFYNFINSKSEEDFKNYINNVKKLSIYDTKVDAVYGEQLMTLYTCEYSQENGRFVVVAKKI